MKSTGWEENLKGQLFSDNLTDIAGFTENVTDISIPVSEFSRLSPVCDHVFIVENEMNYLTFPNLASSIVIWGKGNNVQNLKSIQWLKEKKICNEKTSISHNRVGS